MTKDQEKAMAKKVARYSVLIGFLLALACNLLPPEHRALCQTIVSICTP